MICTCLGVGPQRTGWTLRDDGLWVDARCRQPSRLYLEEVVKSDQVQTYLNYLSGGPLDGTVLTNPELVDRDLPSVRPDGERVRRYGGEYRWTDEIRAESDSTRLVRVWTHRGA